MVAANVALFIEILTLKFPSYFLMLASLGNCGKAISFLLAAASRAQVNVKFAKRNNVADIAGKAVSQFTSSMLVGVGIGLIISKFIDITSFGSLACCFVVFSGASILSNYYSVFIIKEEHFNN